jgi:hypothetical protein
MMSSRRAACGSAPSLNCGVRRRYAHQKESNGQGTHSRIHDKNKQYVSSLSRNHRASGCWRYLNWSVDRFHDQKASQKK